MIDRVYSIGVDAGYTGGLAVIDASLPRPQLVDAIPTPLVPGFKTKADRQVDHRYLAYWADMFGPGCALGVAEQSHNYGSKVKGKRAESPESARRYGEVRGIVKGQLAQAGVEVWDEPEPGPWKAALGVTSDKTTSIELAMKLYPNALRFIAVVKGDHRHGVAESILLAHRGAMLLRGLARRGR